MLVCGLPSREIPLYAVLALGGGPLVWELVRNITKGRFGSDFLAGISIVSAALLGEYLAGAIVVLMLSGGEALESYAVGRASSALQALAKRMPLTAHRRTSAPPRVSDNQQIEEIEVEGIRVGDAIVIFPHEVAPVDGVVLEGHSSMDESYLTGEPFQISKSPGCEVISGSVNGSGLITIKASKLPTDSRYAKIMKVLDETQQFRPKLRRLGDQIGALYTPLAVAVAAAAWIMTGDPIRFLAVLVVATPCPLLIAIPVSIIGAVSLAARRSIVIRDPGVLEQIETCRTVIFDKTGTLTVGQPVLSEIICEAGYEEVEVLKFVASIERYSKHPLAAAVLEAAKARELDLLEAQEVSELPGKGVAALVEGKRLNISGRDKLEAHLLKKLPDQAPGLECVVLIDGTLAALMRFRDEPRTDTRPFIKHLRAKHAFERVLLVSGDRESEVRYLAEKVGIGEVYAGQSPEQKVAIVKREVSKGRTIFVGDGINDAPALVAATVGVAFGSKSDVTSEAAGAVILESSLRKFDELMHIGEHMRAVALQSALGGIALSMGGMLLAALGFLPPVSGAVFQEVIDLFAVLNALRAGQAPRVLSDYR
ncbi:MAG: cadmium-translocating P-type ATPase [Proteobacteria bacterium]|nr:MAG: cadmium-translocating P-type ATPase [Pseudomonadota bacterium]